MFKKLTSALLLGALCAFSMPAQAQEDESFGDVAEKVGKHAAVFIPNVVMDVLDLFSLQLGAGPVVGLEGRLTRYAQLGAQVGRSYHVAKMWNRQWGYGVEEGGDVSVACFTWEHDRIFDSSRGLHKYEYNTFLGGERTFYVPNPLERVYDWKDGYRDIWACSIEAALLVQVKGSLHPFELVDLGVNILTLGIVDLRVDDWTWTEYKAFMGMTDRENVR